MIQILENITHLETKEVDDNLTESEKGIYE